MSTRICVKNIPRYITDDKLREHFAQKGEVTDAKIIRTRDGRTRQFGFVGFKSAEEAADAVKYFHRTFFDTSRLACEIAQQIGSQDIPRPWSRHSDGSSAFEKAIPTTDENPHESVLPKNKAAGEGKKPNVEDEGDPELQEFLQLMQPRAKTKIWANDTMAGVAGGENSQGRKSTNIANKKSSKLEVRSVEGFARRVPINKGKSSEKVRQFHVRFEDESDSDEETVAEPLLDRLATDRGEEERPAVDEVEEDGFVNDATVSDMQYLKSRVKGNWSDDEDENESETEQLLKEEVKKEVEGDVYQSEGSDEAGEEEIDEEANAGESAVELVVDVDERKDTPSSSVGHNGDNKRAAPVSAEQQEDVSETGRLFVRNLPYTASGDDLSELFSKFGQLSQVHLVLDKETKQSKGFAYILYMLPEDAVRAMEKLDKSTFQGRLLHILAAKRPPPAPEPKANASGPGTTKYKLERESQRKASEANGDTRAWNTLIMRPDTVAENVAKKYGMTKSEFMDPEAGDLAVRMALGETHIIAETKRALSDEGVNVKVLEEVTSGRTGQLKRSDTVILVKNLPFTTSEDDLVSMFSAHGSIGRVILPSTKTLALVEYLEAAEARRAFKSLAYKRYQHVPLYLEWAPVNLLTEAGPLPAKYGAGKVKVLSKAVGQDLVKRVEVEQNLIGHSEDDVDLNPSQARSLFVKNLNFSTTQGGLKKHFQQHTRTGSIKNVTIKTKPSKNGKVLSMGFGFVELDNMETAAEVCKQLQGTVLDGHALILQLSHAKIGGQAGFNESRPSKERDKSHSSTKVIVRNVAFEATRKDLQLLFNPFGQIKSLRLPKKFDGNHRGFAFVEFMTRQEAENAFSGLKSTHLYGRHLVLERAKDGESLDELRARTAQQFFADNGVETNNDRPQKKRKTSGSVGDRSAAFDLD